MRILFPGASLLVAACVATAPPPSSWSAPAPASSVSPAPAAATPAIAPGRYRVTVISASIRSRRPDGSAWHIRKANGALKLVAGVVGTILGSAELGVTAGDVLAGDDDVVPPRPYVELHVGGREYETYATKATLAPEWSHELAVDLDRVAADDLVVLVVKDGLDDGAIGEVRLTASQLVSRPAHTLDAGDSIPTLSIAVEPMPPRRPATYEVWVPANATFDELAAGGVAGWQAVPVEAGDVIDVVAEGEGCIKPGRCHDAKGNFQAEYVGSDESQILWVGYRYNYPLHGFSPNGSLVGDVAGTPAFVGTANRFVARRRGVLQLFMNDTDARNNSGGFRVTVRVNP